MIYLTPPCGDTVIARMGDDRIGLIDSPRQRMTRRVAAAHARGVAWGADNGAFSDKWDAGQWWSWLTNRRQLAHVSTCLFATAPDVVGDAAATWERSKPWLGRMRDLGYRVAYVGQDGLADLPWGEFDVLFLGGSTEWKLGPEARRWTEAAIARGVPVHMGRVNSQRRFTYARAIGCSSVDGTYLTRGPDANLSALLSWARSVDQPFLV